MSGHSKWKTNKGKKMAADAKKGAMYTKLIKEITIVAREGGGNPENNSKLRTVMQRAKEANMPLDNVKMAIKRGTGELPGVIYETVRYEGFGPGGTAIMIDAITDNKNRCAAEVRNIMSKKNGSLGGSVSWMFSMKGYIEVDKSGANEDDVMTVALVRRRGYQVRRQQSVPIYSAAGFGNQNRAQNKGISSKPRVTMIHRLP
jgi:YebC/PmpR family DNA-binding regulatory protein